MQSCSGGSSQRSSDFLLKEFRFPHLLHVATHGVAAADELPQHHPQAEAVRLGRLQTAAHRWISLGFTRPRHMTDAYHGTSQHGMAKKHSVHSKAAAVAPLTLREHLLPSSSSGAAYANVPQAESHER